MRKSVLIFLVLISGFACFAQTKNQVLKIKGSAILYQIPEMMHVNIPIEVTDSLYEACSFKLEKIHKELKKKLVKNGIEESFIKTDRLSFGEKTKWTKDGPISDGFQASISVNIRMKHSSQKLNQIINTLKDEKFNFGYRVSWGLSEKQKSESLEKSIELAIDDANTKAQIIAKKMNLQLLEIKEVNFGYSGGGFSDLTPEHDIFFSMAPHENLSVKTVAIDVNPEKISIRKTVNVIWKVTALKN